MIMAVQLPSSKVEDSGRRPEWPVQSVTVTISCRASLYDCVAYASLSITF